MTNWLTRALAKMVGLRCADCREIRITWVCRHCDNPICERCRKDGMGYCKRCQR